MIFALENHMPSLTLRQIYSADNMYLQFFQNIGLHGASAGFVASKAIPITDSLTWTTSLRGNFTDYNWHNKLRYQFNKNVSASFKVVSNHFNKKTITNLQVFIPNDLSAKLEFKDVNNIYGVGLSVFLKEGHRFGIKPSFFLSSVHCSFPVVLAQNYSYAAMPIKVVLGLFSLAGLLFYNWSDADDSKHQRNKAVQRYREACSHRNSNRGVLDREYNHTLNILAAFAWDSTIHSQKKIIQQILTKDLGCSIKGKDWRSKVEKAVLQIRKDCDLTYDITEEIESSILMDSIKINLEDKKIHFLSTIPRVDANNKVSIAIIYQLDGQIKSELFKEQVLIGRRM